MNLGKLLGKAITLAKQNPEIALAVVGLAAPGLARAAAKSPVAAAVIGAVVRK